MRMQCSGISLESILNLQPSQNQINPQKKIVVWYVDNNLKN